MTWLLVTHKSRKGHFPFPSAAYQFTEHRRLGITSSIETLADSQHIPIHPFRFQRTIHLRAFDIFSFYNHPKRCHPFPIYTMRKICHNRSSGFEITLHQFQIFIRYARRYFPLRNPPQPYCLYYVISKIEIKILHRQAQLFRCHIGE